MINTQYNTNNDILIGRATVAVNSAAITEKAETAESKVKVNKRHLIRSITVTLLIT